MCEKCDALLAQKQNVNFNCEDCGNDTSPATGIGEYYMVGDGVWRQATALKPAKMLCVGCLEKRLGRELRPDDFYGYSLNYLGAPQSPRLRIRLGEATAEELISEFKAADARYWAAQTQGA
jgi:hypothetical protein